MGGHCPLSSAHDPQFLQYVHVEFYVWTTQCESSAGTSMSSRGRMGCSSLSRLDGCSEGKRTPLERATAFCARSAPPCVAAVLADFGAGVVAVLRLAAGVIRICSWRARSSLRKGSGGLSSERDRRGEGRRRMVIMQSNFDKKATTMNVAPRVCRCAPAHDGKERAPVRTGDPRVRCEIQSC